MSRTYKSSHARRTSSISMLLVSVVALLWPGEPCALGQAATVSRYSITLPEAVSALQAAHLVVTGADVRLLAHLTATTAAPQLEVESIEPWGQRNAHVRLACTVAEQCLPFYVAVQWPAADQARAAMLAAGVVTRELDRVQAPAAGPGSAAARGMTSGPGTSRPVDKQVSEVPATLHAGSRATLLIDGERLHIRVPVICLEAGNVGRVIRVTALDHRQTYKAEVIDATLLEGAL